MMTRKYKLTLTLIILFFSQGLFAATKQGNWIIAAEQFSFTRNQTGSLADGLAQMLPEAILEKLSTGMYRNIPESEESSRLLYQLRQEKNSLFLQLSSQVKKRDSIFLGNYSQQELKEKLQEADQKVNEIKDKLADNLKQEEACYKILSGEESYSQVNQSKLTEKVSLYKNSISALYKPSGQEIEKEVIGEGINCLLRGTITAYDEYISVTVEAFLFPGEKLIATITEIGSIDGVESMALSIARALSPVIANSMPVTINITIIEPENTSKVKVYIDDILYSDISQTFTIDSGIHFIQFTAENYKNAGTNYYFEGNKYYDIKVSLEALDSKILYINEKNSIPGNFIINGKASDQLEDATAKIIINEKAVLGQFITEENTSAFIYIPENKFIDKALYTASLKPVNHSDYIEKSRRRMYLSYSIFVTSLVPTIITSGRLKNYINLFNSPASVSNLKANGNYDDTFREARIWNTSAIISTSLSVAAGAWFVFELYRYFKAANSVLPANTKIDFNYTEAETSNTNEEKVNEISEE